MLDLTKYMVGADNPASLTSQDEEKKKEAWQYLNLIPEDLRHGKLLIIGAGDGYEIEVAEQLGFSEVKGLVYLEKEKTSDKLIIGDMHELPFPDKEFDFVYSKETLEHAIAPYVVACEINRVLKINGKFCLATSGGLRKQREWYHYSCFPIFIWMDLFHKASLEIEKIMVDGYIEFHNNIFFGSKIVDKDILKPTEMYSLEDYINGIKMINLNENGDRNNWIK